MCGIAGMIHNQDLDPKKILEALKHRGPDAQGIFSDNDVTLIHTRLAIQDIGLGQQPFQFQHYIIIFNGEIYNHLALRDRLTEFQFKTKCDTETLLYLFIKYRFAMFDLLDGMFAFCIYDQKQKEIIFARDRAGKKPLYYFYDQKQFIFASELNAIKTVTRLRINTDAIQCYLRTGIIWRPYTAYENVYELEAGSYLILELDQLKLNKLFYFDMLKYYESPTLNTNLSDCINNLEKTLTASIENRLTASDVEVGVFLSGGIDSNLIAAIAAQIKPNIKTFTVKFSDGYDESTLARIGAQKYKTTHIELDLQNNLEDIDTILQCYGEPFMDSSAIPSFYIARAARQHVKVVLSGDGADELFGGYRRYVPVNYSVLQLLKWFYPLLKWLPPPHQKKSFYNYFYRLSAMLNKKNLDFYLAATTDIFEDAVHIQDNKIIEQLGKFIVDILQKNNLSLLQKMLYLDFNILLFCDLLVKMDIASMANGLEVRSPFLAKDLLEFAPTLPDHFKIANLKTKFILRTLGQKFLPSNLIQQPKRGFEVPLKSWVDGQLKPKIFSALGNGCYSENFIKKNFISDLLNKKVHISAEKRAKILWSLYSLEIWHRHEKNYFSS